MFFSLKLSVLIAITIASSYVIYSLLQPIPLPKVDEGKWWGPGDRPSEEDISIRPFKINISEKLLTNLQSRLENTRPFTPPLEDIQQQYGFNTNLLNKIITYWRNDYKWRERELYLNHLPQFSTNVQGLNIHYIHVKPKVSQKIRTLPLLLLHGWPGSVREFYKIIPMLTTSREGHDFVFEVVAPSLPGFAFSDGTVKPGLSAVQMGTIFKNLMKRLGHDEFYVQGGDWGAIIASSMATLFPDNILGLHSNMCFARGIIPYLKLLLGSLWPSMIVDEKYEHKMFPLLNKLQFDLEESGYFHIQATKPDTVGVAVGQSPAGLAAYILERFSTGTNVSYKSYEDGGLLEKFTYDELLDNVMLYWITNSFTTSVRIYAEWFTKSQRVERVIEIPIAEKVPCACARFGQEIYYQTDWILKHKYTNLIHSSDFDKGGHFAAFEEPELLAQDMFVAIGKMEDFRKNKQNK